ncbi:heme a synthase, partial [Phenoliferia sp. Uapishka_3]
MSLLHPSTLSRLVPHTTRQSSAALRLLRSASSRSFSSSPRASTSTLPALKSNPLLSSLLKSSLRSSTRSSPSPLLSTLSTHRTFFTARRTSSPTVTAPVDGVYPDPPESRLPTLTTPDVSKYLFAIAALVFTIVFVGGMTRLTESGLSITEWALVTGAVPPLSAGDWESEFAKYRDTPEWRKQNQHITLKEFKTIYLWEWSHRQLGRFIGLSFLAPIPYFLIRKRLSPRATLSLLGIGTLIGSQGAMGWYMVKSGLDEEKVDQLGGVARVSQYRLAAHLGMAFLVYSSCLRLALGIGRDAKIAGQGKGIGGIADVAKSLEILNTKAAGKTRVLVNALTVIVFITALSGAFVAGLDAGLIYNEFPYMGEHIHPPKSELMDPRFARKADGSDKWWRNMLENPVTAQFDHRVIAMTTFASIVSLFLYVRRPSIKPHLPPHTFRLIKATMHMSFLQVALGISTLIYLVPIPLASAHQAGSLVLLSLAIAAGASLRRPGKVAREIMKARRMAVKA